jgi:hypothetical protein
MLKVITPAVAALFVMTSAASALTVSNTGSKDFSIGVDMGNQEMTKTVAAGKSAKIDGCKDGCGVTGPWGYSKWANAGDEIKSDGSALVTK